jgi:putative SOS response-associated peptidase YedK
VRAKGRTFPTHRCLVPASKFRHRSQGKHYRFALANGDWFYFAGIWRPATREYAEAYAILTTAPNDDVAPYHDRQMAVLLRERRMDWLDITIHEEELLRPLPTGTFRVEQLRSHARQPVFAF